MTLFDAIGLIGVAMIVVAYFLNQVGRLTPRDPVYSIVNAVGAGLVLFTLYFEFNLAAAVVEGFWLLVSLFGLRRAMSQKERLSNKSGRSGRE